MMEAFVMMPYRPEFEQVYDAAIRPALTDAGLAPLLVKDEHYVGAVFERVQRSIRTSRLCVADVTGANPNVMWEAAYGEALGKPIVFIAQGTPETVPFNIRQNRCIIYETTEHGLSALRQEIRQTVGAVLEGEMSDLQMLRQIVLPASIKGTPAAFVVASSPLSYRSAYRVDTGWRERRATTFSDYVGIRGLMRSFGLILGMQGLPELLSPDDFADDALDRPMHLYLIGSPKANRWTGLMMERFFADKDPKWDFRPDPESRDIRNPRVILRANGKPHTPVGWQETSRIKKDFGLVVRGPHPRDGSFMLAILAGRSALGTEAASLAVTDPSCIRKLSREIVHRDMDPEDHRQGFYAIVSVEARGKDAEYATAPETFHVWHVARC